MKISKLGDVEQYRLTSLIFIAFVLAACSGGGGGGSDSSSAVNYTGATSQAVVTNSNGDDLSAGAALGVGTGSSTSLVGTATSEVNPPAKLRSLSASMAIKKALGRMDYATDGGNQLAGAMVSDSDILWGTCGGSASYSVTADDVTGDFNGTINFSGYCDDGDTLTGGADFSGNIDINTLAFNSINLSTSSLTITSGGDTFAVAGSFSFTSVMAGSETLLMTLNIRDAAGTVYRIENLQCAITYDSPTFGTDRIRIVSGRYFHPVYGYVDVITTSDFLINSDYPYAGVLLVTGSGGSKAELTANSDAQTFSVMVDADGIGGYDGPATTYRWDSI